jgi:hypothetical protein
VNIEAFDRVRQGFGRRLSAEGWMLLEQDPFDVPGVGTFALPLKGGFVATAMVVDRSDGDESGTVASSASGVMGLDYEPARKLTMALTGFAQSGVVLREPSLTVGLSDGQDVDGAVDALVTFTVEQAPLLASVADVDTIVEMLDQDRAVEAVDAAVILRSEGPIVRPSYAPESLDTKIELVSALLVAAGRYVEARRFLDEHLQPGWPRHAAPEDRRFVRQLTRWIDHDGKLALPTTPAQWPPQMPRPKRIEPSGSIPEFLAQNRPEIQARTEAVKAVRAVGRGKTRDELRVLLKQELDKRAVRMEPVGFAQTVDSIATEHQPLGKARIALRGIRALRDLGQSRRPHVSETPGEPTERSDDQPEPAWLMTPERAVYPIWSASTDRVAVELDPTAEPWLKEAMRTTGPGAVQSCNIEVWLAPDDGEPPSRTSRLGVHIGSRRVGYLDAETTDVFRPAIEAAAERDEDAQTDAHLTRIPGGIPYVLDLPLSAAADT